MTRRTPQYECSTCGAERVTVSGIESHIMHRHPEVWRAVLADFTIQPYIRILEGDA